MMPTIDIKLNDGLWEAWVSWNGQTKLIHIGTEIPCQQNADLLVARIKHGNIDYWDLAEDYSKLEPKQLKGLRAIFL